MNEQQENEWLTAAPISKAILHMSIPMMLGMCDNLIYGLIYIRAMNQRRR